MDSITDTYTRNLFYYAASYDVQQVKQSIDSYKQAYQNQQKLQNPLDRISQHKDRDGRHILHYACMYNKDDVAVMLLTARDENSENTVPGFRTADNFQVTPLMYAARAGLVDFVNEWIKQKYDVKSMDKKRRNVLHYCCSNGVVIPDLTSGNARQKPEDILMENVDKVTVILYEEGVDPLLKDFQGQSVIKLALHNKRYAIVPYIITDYYDLDFELDQVDMFTIKIMKIPLVGSPGVFGGMLHFVLQRIFNTKPDVKCNDKVAIFEKIVTKYGFDVNETDSNGMTPLHHLCYIRFDLEPYGLREGLIAKLLELGADKDIEDVRGCTPLTCAIEKNFISDNDTYDPMNENKKGIAQLLGADCRKSKECQINEALKTIQNELMEIKEENTKLKDELKLKQDKIDKLEKRTDRIEEHIGLKVDLPTKSLLFGNLFIPDAIGHLDDKVEINLQPGVSTEELQAVLEKDEEKFKKIYIVKTVKNQITDEIEGFEKLLKAAKLKAESVVCSSLLPCLYVTESASGFGSSDISEVNTALKELCTELDCLFIDNDVTFQYRDGTINELYFEEDGENLSKSGAKQLLRNLGIFVKNKDKPSDI